MAEQIKGKYLIYRGLPLVRENNMICYGSMKDKYILYMMILSYKEIVLADNTTKVSVPDRIIGQIVSTDPKCMGADKIVKNFEKNGLYEAFDMGIAILERYNRTK